MQGWCPAQLTFTHPPRSPFLTAPQEAQRRAAYLADVTYVTNSELGFDYLRDNLAQEAESLVLRDFSFCIIDEVDSILIDEARTPLIISGPADPPGDKYSKACRLAAALVKGVHYTVDEKQRSVLLTEDGYEAAEDVLQVGGLEGGVRRGEGVIAGWRDPGFRRGAVSWRVDSGAVYQPGPKFLPALVHTGWHPAPHQTPSDSLVPGGLTLHCLKFILNKDFPSP